MSEQFPPVRLAALDLDGTLLNRHGEVTPATRAALERAAANGVVIVPATGRPLASLPPVVAQLPGVRYAITSNGAAVWDLGKDPLGAVYSRYANAAQHVTSQPECLLHRLLPAEKAREVFEVCMDCHADLRIFADGYACTDRASMEYSAMRFARKGNTEARQPDDGRFTVVRDFPEWMSRHAFEVEKMCVFFGSVELTNAALPRFRAIRDVEVVQGSPENVEVTAAGVDKGEAVLALARMLGIPAAQTLAVGDSENDCAMLHKAGISAVMANGMAPLKEWADLVSKADCNHDGVAELFERLHL